MKRAPRRARLAVALLRAVTLVAAVAALPLAALPLPAGAQTSGTAEAAHKRVNGATVYDIAAAVAGGRCGSSEGSHSVALASGENWPDALAGSALDRPLLLTKRAFLPAPTREYLLPCKTNSKAKVIILGGPAAVSTGVEEELESMGYTVDRIAGRDRYETARKVARQFAPDELANVYLASGRNYADAVAAAPSVSKATPLILTEPKSLQFHAMRFLTADGFSVGRVTILGGPAAVSEAVESELGELGLATRRISGSDRYETAVKIASESLGSAGCHPVRDVAVASGVSPYGGLAAASVRGRCEPLLLAPKSDQDVPESLNAFGRDWKLAVGGNTALAVTAIGSHSLVPDAALNAVATGPGTPGGSDSSNSGTSGSDGSSNSGGSNAARDWDDAARSVVQVLCLNSAGRATSGGSGFVVGDGRQIVTNQHVIVDSNGHSCDGLSVRLGGNFSTAPTRSVSATVVRSNRSRDLALLAIGGSELALPPVTISGATLRAGDEITALGYPGVGGDTMTLTTGRYSGSATLKGQVWLKTDAQISPGNSGGAAFDSRHRLVGVPTAVNVAEFSGGTELRGLGLLVPASDVTALIDGTLDSRSGSSGSPGSTFQGNGEWFLGTFSNTREPYIRLSATASDHTLEWPWNDLEPALVVSCDGYVEVDFWSPVLRRWGGPYIGGQIDYRNPERHDKIPVAWRFGDGEFTAALWEEASDNKSFLAFGSVGSRFVNALLGASEKLSLGWTNFDGETNAIVFPRVEGVANAYRHLDTC